MIIVGTGVLYALADRRDAHHEACAHWLASAPRPLVVAPMVIAEACYLIGRHLGLATEATFLDELGPGASGTPMAHHRQRARVAVRPEPV